MMYASALAGTGTGVSGGAAMVAGSSTQITVALSATDPARPRCAVSEMMIRRSAPRLIAASRAIGKPGSSGT